MSKVPTQGIRYVPVACVKLTCLKRRSAKQSCTCSSPNGCGLIKPISYVQYQNKFRVPYTIHEGKIKGNELIIKMSFSGCSDEDMELQLAEGPFMGPTPIYLGLLEYPKTACEMLITKEVCFDISKYPATSTFQLKDANGTVSVSR
jgi:hypothetical protein